MAVGVPFLDRAEAGQAVAERLLAYRDRPDVLILALPRGGIPVACEVAQVLHAPMDVFVVRKLGVPGREELAMGAIASGGVRVLNEQVVGLLGIPPADVEAVTQRELVELRRREQAYRGDRPPPQIEGRQVILIDDGLATGATMRAAVAAVRQQRPARVIVAVPVAAAETCAELAAEVDEMACVATPEPFYAVGIWYRDFSETSDQEVRALLERSWAREAAGRPG